MTYKKTKQKLNIRLLKPNYTGPILSPYMQRDLFYQERFSIKSNQLNNQMTTQKWRRRKTKSETLNQQKDLPGQQENGGKGRQRTRKSGTLTHLLLGSYKFGLSKRSFTLLNINTRVISINRIDQWLIGNDQFLLLLNWRRRS